MPGTESGSASATSCALCGGPIPSWAPAGHCPACLLNLGSSFGDVTAPGDELFDPVQLRRCGDYELLEEVARGGMGVVYRARQLSLGREVAVKMILAGELATAESVARFRNEATAAAKLDHPNIVSVYEVGQHDMQHFFSMRFVGGRENIATWAKGLASPADLLPAEASPLSVPEGHQKLAGGANPRNPIPTRPAPAGAMEDSRTPAGVHSVFDGFRWFRSFLASPPANFLRPSGTSEHAVQIAAMLAKVARAVAFAHARGVLHRDLKPSNILVDENREPQVTDFGLAKLVDDDSDLTLSAAMLGSPSYMAPEQADARHREVTTATDVYGLGAVLYELLAGRPPFAGPTPLATARMVVEHMPAKLDTSPRDLATLCLKCLAKEPAQRYASALSVAEDLERFVRGEPIRARPVTAPEALWRWMRRKPAIAALLGAVLLAFVLGFAGVTWQWRRAERAGVEQKKVLDHLRWQKITQQAETDEAPRATRRAAARQSAPLAGGDARHVDRGSRRVPSARRAAGAAAGQARDTAAARAGWKLVRRRRRRQDRARVGHGDRPRARADRPPVARHRARRGTRPARSRRGHARWLADRPRGHRCALGGARPPGPAAD